jgi:hypothetical protein
MQDAGRPSAICSSRHPYHHTVGGRLVLNTVHTACSDHHLRLSQEGRATIPVYVHQQAHCCPSRDLWQRLRPVECCVPLPPDAACYRCTTPSRQAYTAACVRSATWSLLRILLTWLLTVFSLITNCAAISVLLAVAQVGEGIDGVLSRALHLPHHARRHLRVQHRLAPAAGRTGSASRVDARLAFVTYGPIGPPARCTMFGRKSPGIARPGRRRAMKTSPPLAHRLLLAFDPGPTRVRNVVSWRIVVTRGWANSAVYKSLSDRVHLRRTTCTCRLSVRFCPFRELTPYAIAYGQEASH